MQRAKHAHHCHADVCCRCRWTPSVRRSTSCRCAHKQCKESSAGSPHVKACSRPLACAASCQRRKCILLHHSAVSAGPHGSLLAVKCSCQLLRRDTKASTGQTYDMLGVCLQERARQREEALKRSEVSLLRHVVPALLNHQQFCRQPTLCSAVSHNRSHVGYATLPAH